MVMPRVVKPKTKRGKRFLEGREPKVNENVKKAMFVNGGRTNEVVRTALKQFYMLKKPNSTMLAQRNIMRPFDDCTKLEFISEKNDHSLFMFGSHSKKRPNNLIIGRMFDHHVLDMFEFSITSLIPMEKFKTPKIAVGTKPCIVFFGEPFDVDPEYMRLKCLFTDFFRGDTPDNIRLEGMEHVISFSAIDGKIHIKNYKVSLVKTEEKVPRVELEEMGPAMDLIMNRNKISSDDLYKKSKKQPKEITGKPKKNVSYDAFGSKLGRIHMEKQDLGKLQTRKLKALKRKNGEDKTDNDSKKVKNGSSNGDDEGEQVNLDE